MLKEFYELLCANCNSPIGWTVKLNDKDVNYCDSCKEDEEMKEE